MDREGYIKDACENLNNLVGLIEGRLGALDEEINNLKSESARDYILTYGQQPNDAKIEVAYGANHPNESALQQDASELQTLSEATIYKTDSYWVQAEGSVSNTFIDNRPEISSLKNPKDLEPNLTEERSYKDLWKEHKHLTSNVDALLSQYKETKSELSKSALSEEMQSHLENKFEKNLADYVNAQKEVIEFNFNVAKWDPQYADSLEKNIPPPWSTQKKVEVLLSSIKDMTTIVSGTIGFLQSYLNPELPMMHQNETIITQGNVPTEPEKNDYDKMFEEIERPDKEEYLRKAEEWSKSNKSVQDATEIAHQNNALAIREKEMIIDATNKRLSEEDRLTASKIRNLENRGCNQEEKNAVLDAYKKTLENGREKAIQDEIERKRLEREQGLTR